MTDHDLSDAETCPSPLFERWRASLAARGIVAPTAEDFASFGSLSTLERLAPEIDGRAPLQGAALRQALRELRREKRSRRPPAACGGRRGPAPTLSVDEADLPATWRSTLDAWRRERRRVDAGGIVFDGPPPPAADIIDHVAYVLRAIARVCACMGAPCALSVETVGAWLSAAEARGCKAAGLAIQVGLLVRFLCARGDQPDLVDRLRIMARLYRRRAGHETRRKEA